ncbi:hypothetical protein [Amycolatopsis sp. lyj-109]|uniref:hypothetical protein n=1 Tax=Amycolatopsis sp. lyj-109 TaxID=2789287 RepID=UPI003978D21D
MIDLSASADPEIALTARVLVGVDAADLDYLVVGATARTILKIAPFSGRMTSG